LFDFRRTIYEAEEAAVEEADEDEEKNVDVAHKVEEADVKEAIMRSLQPSGTLKRSADTSFVEAVENQEADDEDEEADAEQRKPAAVAGVPEAARRVTAPQAAPIFNPYVRQRTIRRETQILDELAVVIYDSDMF